MNRFFKCAAALLALAAAAVTTGRASAGGRVALVIGNSAYQHAAMLPNTVNDADAMADLFKKAGFDLVEERRNVDVVEFKRAVREFLSAAQDADIAVVYYSGHGMEVGGINYLIPIDARLASDFDTEDEAIALDRIVQAVQPARKLRLIILDACRDNPFISNSLRPNVGRSVIKGLAPVDPAGGVDTLIAYAAKAGSVSYDGTGKNSPFTTALVKYLTEPGLDIRIALGRVRDDVLKHTENRQEPFFYGSLGGSTVSLVPVPEAAAPPKVAPPPVDPNAIVAREYKAAERVGTRQAWEAFLAIHNSGFYAELARAQLMKLALQEAAAPPPAPPATPAPPQPVVPPPVVPPPLEAKITPPAPPSAACKREEDRLAALRSNPVRQEVDRFAHEMTCDALRPQVARLLESLGDGPAAPAPPSAPSPTPVAEALPPQQVIALLPPEESPVKAMPHPEGERKLQSQDCKSDETRLARLRENPTREEAGRFAREFTCEELRPQISRLLESLGIETGQQARSVPVRTGPEVAALPHETQEQACKRDQRELSRLRANPDREEIVRFVRGLSCKNLQPQAARLLESVGD